MRSRVFNTKESVLAMFNDLFKENLVYTFFNTLEYAHEFKREVYSCDFCDLNMKVWKCRHEEKTVIAFLQMISSNKMSSYLVERASEAKMSDRVEELILTAAQLVDINRMVLIADRGTIIPKTKSHVIDLFKLFE